VSFLPFGLSVGLRPKRKKTLEHICEDVIKGRTTRRLQRKSRVVENQEEMRSGVDVRAG